MKKFFKIASYALLYVLITFASAFAVIFLVPPPSSNGGANNKDNAVAIPRQFSQILDRLTTAEGLDVFLQADIETQTNNYSIIVDALVNLENGFENLSADGNIEVKINDDIFNVGLSYSKNVLYFDMLNGKFKIETKNIMDSVNKVLEILNVELPEMEFDMSSLDVNALLGMLGNLEEKKYDNSILIKLDFPIIGEIFIDCDLNYQINSFSIPEQNIDDKAKIKVTSNFDYRKVEVENPAVEEYIDISDLFVIAESVLETLSKEEIGLNLNLKYNDLSLNAFLSANLKKLDSKLTIANILGYDLNLIAINNVIYLELGNIKLSYSLENVKPIEELLSKQFGIEIPLEKVTGILVALNQGNLVESIGQLFPEGNKIDINSIDLSILEGFEKVDERYSFDIKGIGTIGCTITGDKLEDLSFSGFGIDASVKLENPKEISLAHDSSEYLNMESILPALDAALSTFKNTNFNGSFVIEIGNKKYIADYQLSLDGQEKYAHFVTEIFGQKVAVIVENENVYLQLSNVKIKANLSDIALINEFIKNNFASEEGNKVIEVLLEKVKTILNPEKYPALITSIENKAGILSMTTLGDGNIDILYSETIDAIKFSFEEVKGQLSINATKQPIEKIEVDESEYLSVENLLAFAQNALDYIRNGEYYIDAYINFEGIEISALINYDEKGLSALLAISYQQLNATIKLVNKKLYLEIGENYLMFDPQDIGLVIEFIKSNLGIDVYEKLQEILGIMPLSDEVDLEMNFRENLESILTSLNLSATKEAIVLEILGGKIGINIADDFISSIEVEMNDISAKINVESTPNEIQLDKTYTNISEILPYLQMLINYVSSEQYYLQASADVFENGEIIYTTDDARIEFDMTEKVKLYAAVKVSGRDNHSMEVFYHEDTLYANYNEFLLKINGKDLGEIVSLLLQMAGVDPNILPFLSEAAGDLKDFNLSSLSLPSISISPAQIASVLGMFKGIEIANNTLSFNLNLFGEIGKISIVTDGENLQAITFDNIAVSNAQKFNLEINCLEFNGVQTPDKSKNWVDISGSNELIKAILNMIDVKDFEIAGTFNVDMIVTQMNVPFNLKLKLVDGKPEMMMVLGPIPAKKILVNINQDAPKGYNSDDRTAYIYYKDEYVYIHRSEKNAAYQKKTKVHYSEFMKDPMSYLQYIVGLDDWIMDLIYERMNATREVEFDVSKIIREFKVSEDKMNFDITLDLKVLSGNKDLDKISLGFKIVKNDQLDKNVINNISFGMNVPFTSTFGLNMAANDITLDVTKNLDMTQMYEFIQNYDYNENEQWEIIDGNANKSKIKTYTIVLNENGGEDVADITAEFGAEIALPTFADRTSDDLVNMERNTLRFAGWYEDEAFTHAFTEKTMPRFGATLYAKWELISSERILQLSFDTTGGYEINSVYLTEKQPFDLATLSPSRKRDAVKGKWTIKGYEWSITRYSFEGWYLDSELTIKLDQTIQLNENITIYAKWNESYSTVTQYGEPD